MKKIVSLQGGMAAGKTTLAKRLEEMLPEVYFSYENPYPVVAARDEMKFDIYTKEGFVNNQRLFLESEIKRYENLPDKSILFDRGPEDIEFYTLYFPRANGFDWDMEHLLKDELSQLRKCRSDHIIYLDASIETLMKRKASDKERKRSSFNENMKLYRFEREWYKKFPTVFVETENKSTLDIENKVYSILETISFL